MTTTLGYDPSSRLLSIAKSGVTTKFLYDGTDLIAEYDGAGTLLKRYVHGPGDDEPLVSYDYTNGGAKTYLHADDNGSVTLKTDASGAQTGTINKYDEYGLPDANNSGRFQYTGQTWLPEIGMYYYKARLYNPAIGRFMQTDPIGYGDGMNWYAYVHGDPVNGSDPSGLTDYGYAASSSADITVVIKGVRDFFRAWDKVQDKGGACGILGGSNCGPAYGNCPGNYCFTGYGQRETPPSTPAPAATPAGCPTANSLNKVLKDTPMAGEGQDFMNSGIYYNLDPRFLTPIAGIETQFGANLAPGNTFNATNNLYNGAGNPAPYANWGRSINGAGHTLAMNRYQPFDLSNTATAYVGVGRTAGSNFYCHSGCSLKGLNAFMKEMSANPNALHYPAACKPKKQ